MDPTSSHSQDAMRCVPKRPRPMGSCITRPTPVERPTLTDGTALALLACRRAMWLWVCRDALYRLKHNAIQRHIVQIMRILDDVDHVLCDIETVPRMVLLFRLHSKDATIQKLRDVMERQDRRRACCVCFQNASCMLYGPCNHVCVCERCDTRVTDRCPICRDTICDRTRVFFS